MPNGLMAAVSGRLSSDNYGVSQLSFTFDGEDEEVLFLSAVGDNFRNDAEIFWLGNVVLKLSITYYYGIVYVVMFTYLFFTVSPAAQYLFIGRCMTYCSL